MNHAVYNILIIICAAAAIFSASRIIASLGDSRFQQQMEAQSFDQARHMVLERRTMERGAY